MPKSSKSQRRGPQPAPVELTDSTLDGVQGGGLHDELRGGIADPGSSSKDSTTTTDSRAIPEAFR